MKVIHFCNLIPEKVGAYEWVLAEIARELIAGGDRYIIGLAGEPIPEVAQLLREAGAEWRILPGWSEGGGREHPWRFVRPALRLLRAESPDVAAVHFGNELPSLVVAMLCRILVKRPVRWIWEQDQQIQDPGALAAHFSKLRALVPFFSRFVAVYEGGLASMLKRGIPRSRVAVIYNGLRDHVTGRQPGWLHTELGIDPETLLLVSTGWLIPRKRIDFLIRRFAESAARTSQPVALLCIGNGPEQPALEALASELGIAGKVHFLGLRNDVRDILATADILVHASLAETCTYAISESMAAAIPAVVTDAGAAREQIASGEIGFVVGRDDAQAFTEHLTALLIDAALRQRLGSAARARWERRYRVEESAKRFTELYRAVARA